jgi:NADPH-dependent glutamate synthase beta subunit-like oxidoreductase
VEEIKSEASKAFLKRLLDVEKLKFCRECGTCTASCPVAWIFPKHHNPRRLLQKGLLDLREVLTQVGLWLCTRCYRCYNRCPQMLDLPEIFLLMRDLAVEYLPDPMSKLWEVLKLIREEISLAAVYSWLCLRPLEAGRERRKVDRLAIDALERFVAERKRKETSPMPRTREEKIAVIGSGPAGLTAAYELVKKGYSVTVFESLPEPGGMLRVGIPDYRLPKEALNADIDYIKDLGVEIRTSASVGKDVTIDELLQGGYRAVFIATGAHESRELGVEGKELEGVTYALDLLRDFNTGKRIELGERVAVIGGGNVAMDAARTAFRLGAKEVNILYRRSRAEMPANPSEVREAEKEGVRFHFLVAPTRILGKDGQVVAVECIRMELGELDETGRRRPVPIEGSEFIMEVDTIILAVGETSDLSFLPKDVAVTRRNTIAVDPVTMETSLPGVFAGGDVISGPATVIEAIAAGRRAAVSMDRYLRGEGISQLNWYEV